MKKQIKIKEHILIPKHEKLGKDDQKKVLEKFNIKIRQLPAIKSSDPAIEDLKVERGDIVMITRQSPTAGKYIFYRRVS